MSRHAADGRAGLTSRLLAFSRRQPLAANADRSQRLVRDMADLLHRTLGEQIELESVLSPRLWTVEIDQNQLESAVLNLAVNARDAMPDGGKLTIETQNTFLDESYAATDAEVRPGQYVHALRQRHRVRACQSRCSARAFEPFFTTKEPGRGTGLGLSMVYGFVKQSGGHVTIYSEEGRGNDGEALLPASPVERGDARLRMEASRNILRRATTKWCWWSRTTPKSAPSASMSLSELGYRVLQAADAEAALSILRADQRIDLLFTDVVLPGRSGRDAGRRGGHCEARLEGPVHDWLFTQRDRPPRPAGCGRAAAPETVHVRSAGEPHTRGPRRIKSLKYPFACKQR